MNARARGVAEMTAAMTISGTIGLFVLLADQPVFNIVFWRCAIGTLTLLLVCAAMGLFRRGVISRAQIGLAVVGGMAIVTNWIFLFAAYPHTSISIATAVYNMQPFMLVTMGAIFLKERLTRARLGWLVLAFLGMLAIVQGRPQADYVGSDYLLGIALALGAAFFYAIAAIITKKLAGVPPHLIALIQLAVGILMLAPLADFRIMPVDMQGWALVIALGVIHTGVMYILLYGAIQKLPTSLTGSLSFVYPVVAILVDFLAFGIRLHPLQIVGAGGILLAAAGSTLGWSLKTKSTQAMVTAKSKAL
jgi:drug/metabolite transporter (DMT)-like permease